MHVITAESLLHYWSSAELSANLVLFLNMLGALLLGSLVGYERAYHGRAAGMRTYGLVCMASAGLVAVSGYPTYWFAGQLPLPAGGIDPTRTIQGIVTGIGFLGAGMISKDRYSISGLTTAASIWTACAIGVLIGLGFYAAAILLAIMSATCMMWMSKIEHKLPSHPAVSVTLRFKPGYTPNEQKLRDVALERGYRISIGSLVIDFRDEAPEWQFVAAAIGKDKGASIPELARELTLFEGVTHFHLAHARN